MQSAYKKERDLLVCGAVGVCTTTRKELVEEIMSIPVTPVSASVVLVGVPVVVMAKEDPEIREIYDKATIAAIDGMPIVNYCRSACRRNCTARSLFTLKPTAMIIWRL